MKKENIMEFEKVMEKFNELLFEIQIADNKKIIEFQNKLKELKIKIEKLFSYIYCKIIFIIVSR